MSVIDRCAVIIRLLSNIQNERAFTARDNPENVPK